MLWIVIATAIAFFVGVGVTLAGIVSFYALLNAVNATLPEADRFDPLGWHHGKYDRFWNAVSRAEPKGSFDAHAKRYRLLKYSGAAIMFTSILAAAWLLRADR